MSKLKIFFGHLFIFVIGSAGIVAYVFHRLASFPDGAGMGGIILMPAVILVYVIVFGILVLISFSIWLLTSYLRARTKRKKE